MFNLLTWDEIPRVYAIAGLVAIGLMGGFLIRYIFFTHKMIKALLNQIAINNKRIAEKVNKNESSDD